MSRKKRSASLIPWPLKAAFWLFAIGSFLLLFVFPAFTNWYIQQGWKSPPAMTSFVEFVKIAQKWLLRAFVVVWVFFLGGCFASFLNVVAWRLPRGRGVLGSSKCPFCNNKLSFMSNLPVIGWVGSAGRCRFCKLPISPRYLIVEIILGLIFVAVVSVELFCGGISLPLRPVESEWGIESTVLAPKMELFQIAFYHLVLVCLAFVIALVRLERKPIPYSIFVFGAIVGVGLQCLWPVTQQVGCLAPEGGTSIDRYEFWLSLFLGPFIGLILGLLIAFGYRNREQQPGDLRRECVFGFVLIGLFMGSQFAISIALALLLLDALLVIVGDLRGRLFWTSPIYKALALSLLLMLLWRFTSQFAFWPGPYSSKLTLAINLAAITAMSSLIAMIGIPSTSPAVKSDSIQDVI